MSQSEEHRLLVLNISEALSRLYPEILVTADVQATPGAEVPPLIGGFRPDLYAQFPGTGSVIIAEAKTRNDILNEHTEGQVQVFLSHLDRQAEGRFILCALGRGADQAKTLMRFLVGKRSPSLVRVQVFDGCDFWTLDSGNGVLWHLD